ncbi:dihydroorotase [Staphylothermus marinus F1]|uniref:Dihydroorotase n=1 Tax=Staphylothermus marinus (strain ATCC 43588 / DSM 3639 / JCM 9404 / F1) TaxID=399550 RepID=A3DM45_STAMF|nr:dihydroorotase [Staphylothermus marinus]ABN69705.1 dihydroorotase [Staphylothermus marinus F1]
MIPQIIYRGLIYDLHGLRKATLVIENGFIKEILDPWENVSGEIVLDYRRDKEVIAFPGFIDMHVHLRDFKQSYKETIETGTKAALHGGITVVGEMPNTLPRIDNFSILEKRMKILENNSYTDYYVYIDVPENKSDVEQMIRNSVVMGVKLYPEKIGYPTLDYMLEKLGRINKILIVHPEEQYMIDKYKTSLDEYYWFRDVRVEIESIRHVSILSNKFNVKTHITHITNYLSLLEAKRFGYTADTCPHYLLFDYERFNAKNCYVKVLPPIRDHQNRILLYDLFVSGHIDALASDHAPHSVVEKMCCPKTCPPGINGVEVISVFAGDLVSKGIISLDQMYRLLSYNPSRILGLRKYGILCRGCRGNLSIIRFNCKTRIEPGYIVSKAKYSVYDSWEFHSCVEATVIGGKLGFQRGKGFSQKIHGRAVGVLEG